MTTKDSGPERLDRWLKENCVNAKELAERTGLSEQYISDLRRRGPENIGLAAALLIEAATSYEQPTDAGLVDHVPAESWLSAADSNRLWGPRVIRWKVLEKGRENMAAAEVKAFSDRYAQVLRAAASSGAGRERAEVEAAALEELIKEMAAADRLKGRLVYKVKPAEPEEPRESVEGLTPAEVRSVSAADLGICDES